MLSQMSFKFTPIAAAAAAAVQPAYLSRHHSSLGQVPKGLPMKNLRTMLVQDFLQFFLYFLPV